MRETARASSISGEPARVVAGAVAAQVIGGLVAQMSPFVIGGLMDGLSLSERAAGLIASAEFLTLAVTAIAIAPFLPRLSYRRIGLVAVALTLLAQGGSIFSASWTSLILLRGLAGVGEGALYAVSLGVVASHCRNPDKVYGYFQVVWALGSVALFAVGGEITAAFAHRGILALIAGTTAVLAPLLLLVPEGRTADGDRVVTAVAPATPLLGVMTCASIVLYLTVSAGVYAFSAPMGERASLDTSAVGYVLTAASLVGLAGAAAATALNIRWGRAIPISGFCLGYVIVVLVLCLWQHPAAYVTALVASVILYYFSIPYLFGVAAALDQSGRWAAAAGSAYLLGFAVGPFLAGALIQAAGYAGLAAVGVAILAAAWGLAVIVDRRLGRAARGTVTSTCPA